MNEKDSKDKEVVTSKSVIISDTSLASLIKQAIAIGHTEVPSGTTELESKIQAIFDQSGKILSAKQVFAMVKERDAKYYSDKLWYMAKAGKLIKCPGRGWYKTARVTKRE